VEVPARFAAPGRRIETMNVRRRERGAGKRDIL
jgi:hypothetical protein